MTRIGVTFDAGSEDERLHVTNSLEGLGEIVPMAADDSLPGALQQHRPDIVFNLARGRGVYARRFQVPAFLEFFSIPYSGSDALANASCVDRTRMKQVLAYHGIPSAGYTVASTLPDLATFARRSFPVAIRRARGISSCFALMLAHDFDELESIASELFAASSEPIVVEHFLPGDSFACAVLGNGADSAMLPIVSVGADEFAPASSRTDECPARISHGLAEDIESIAVRTYRALHCRDLARIDIRLDHVGVPNVCAVDPLPSFAPGEEGGLVHSAAHAAGIENGELIQRCLLLAAERSDLSLPGMPSFAPVHRRTPPGGMRIR
ncbi:MAG: hypothetical protein ABIZ91_08875 [Gemmatimonadaceae bacterium]